jgi:hypothetical protein
LHTFKEWFDDAMSKIRIALVVLADILLFTAVVLLIQIDQLVNGTLYYYGLVFNNEWAQPYWIMFRICVILIISAIILISLVELPSWF